MSTLSSPGSFVEDYSAPDPNKMGIKKLEQFLDEIKMQPSWRYMADIEAGYYDNYQWTSEEIAILEERGQPITTTNLIKPAIDSIIGAEVRSRTNWAVRAQNQVKEDMQTAEALSVRLNEAEKDSKADRACSRAFASQIKTGMGWVEVTRSPDPFKYPYECNFIHRNEVYWDWRATNPMLDDARYLLRKRWIDEDAAQLIFPDFQHLIRISLNGWEAWESEVISATDVMFQDMIYHAYGIQQQSNLDDSQWVDSNRRRVGVNEIWYRKWVKSKVIRSLNGEVVEFDETNPAHIASVGMGIAQIQEAIFSKVRMSFWIGPFRVMDLPSPYDHRFFPYVPFFGYREDKTGAPYGIIRNMKSPQDEVNARKAKMMQLLSSKRVIADADAVDDHEDAREEISRPDTYITLRPERTNPGSDAFRIESDLQLSSQQFEVMKSAEESIPQVAGLISQMSARPDGKRDRLEEKLDESGMGMVGLIDHFRDGRLRVGELLLSLISADLKGKEESVKSTRGGAGKPVTIALNKSFVDENGIVHRTNNTAKLDSKVVLEEIPQSSTYRSQQFTYLMEISKSLPPEALSSILPSLIEFSEMPNREEVAKMLKKQAGIAIDPDEMSEEEQAQAQEEARMSGIQRDVALRKEIGETEERVSRAVKARADAISVATDVAERVKTNPDISPVVDDIMTMSDKVKEKEDEIDADSLSIS